MANSLVVGSTYRFTPNEDGGITKDGDVWDLSSATVKIYFRRPDGTSFSATATVSSGPLGLAYYDCSTDDLDTAGEWTRTWEVTDGAVVQRLGPIPFAVIDSP